MSTRISHVVSVIEIQTNLEKLAWLQMTHKRGNDVDEYSNLTFLQQKSVSGRKAALAARTTLPAALSSGINKNNVSQKWHFIFYCIKIVGWLCLSCMLKGAV